MATTLTPATAFLQGFRVSRGVRAVAVVMLVVGLAAVSGVGRAAGTSWLTSYDEAMAAAESSQRPILTVFTGSDWCPHCRTLEDNVLHTEAFARWAENRLVLLMIDLPQQGISAEERRARSRVCIKYGVRTFPSVLVIGPDGTRVAGQSGYTGQPADAWIAVMDGHLARPEAPAAAAGTEKPVLSSLDDAVETARDSKRPMLLMVSRAEDRTASTRVASIINDPEFGSLAREHFVVATVPARPGSGDQADGAVQSLLGGVDLPADAVEVIVTDDGQTPLFSQSGSQPPHRLVHGLRRFLATRQSVRR